MLVRYPTVPPSYSPTSHPDAGSLKSSCKSSSPAAEPPEKPPEAPLLSPPLGSVRSSTVGANGSAHARTEGARAPKAAKLLRFIAVPSTTCRDRHLLLRLRAIVACRGRKG